MGLMVKDRGKVFDGIIKEVLIRPVGTVGWNNAGYLGESAVKITWKPELVKLTNSENLLMAKIVSAEIKSMQVYDMSPIEALCGVAVDVKLVGSDSTSHDGTATNVIGYLKNVILYDEGSINSDKYDNGITLKCDKKGKTVGDVFVQTLEIGEKARKEWGETVLTSEAITLTANNTRLSSIVMDTVTVTDFKTFTLSLDHTSANLAITVDVGGNAVDVMSIVTVDNLNANFVCDTNLIISIGDVLTITY
jgi:hypothetical protein